MSIQDRGPQGTDGTPLRSPAVLVVEDQSARAPRKHDAAVDVVVGILFSDQADRFLMTSRPSGKVYAGYWEFPGGKVEPGETVEQALRRELHEELGIEATQIRTWREQRVDYPHALVHLHFMRVTQWHGELQMREAQSFSWETLPVTVSPVLPGAVPVLEWLAGERIRTC